MYGEDDLRVDRFTNSNFQFDMDDRTSTSGFVFVCNGEPISCKSSKQEITADSTTEAEHFAACDAAKATLWVRKFIAELEVVLFIELLISLYVTT